MPRECGVPKRVCPGLLPLKWQLPALLPGRLHRKEPLVWGPQLVLPQLTPRHPELVCDDKTNKCQTPRCVGAGVHLPKGSLCLCRNMGSQEVWGAFSPFGQLLWETYSVNTCRNRKSHMCCWLIDILQCSTE